MSKENDLKRRDILKGMGSVSGVPLLASTVNAKRPENPGNQTKKQKEDAGKGLSRSDFPDNVEKGSGREYQRARKAAYTNKQVKQLRKEFVHNGWKPRQGETQVAKTTEGEQTFYTVIIPFDAGEEGKKEQTYVRWTDSPHADTKVVGYRYDHRTPEDEEAYWHVTAYRGEGTQIVTEEFEMLNFLGCDRVRWDCVLLLASTHSAAIVACGSCVASSGWLVPACASCISTILAASATKLACCWCNENCPDYNKA